MIISEEDYNGLIETLHLSSIPGMKEQIVEGINIPISECLSEDEAEW